ncbi:hypothetical protein Tco_1385352 [Tanacetum coccineum]
MRVENLLVHVGSGPYVSGNYTRNAFRRRKPHTLTVHVLVSRRIPRFRSIGLRIIIASEFYLITGVVTRHCLDITFDLELYESSSICSLCIGNLEPLRLDVLALKANDVSPFGKIAGLSPPNYVEYVPYVLCALNGSERSCHFFVASDAA